MKHSGLEHFLDKDHITIERDGWYEIVGLCVVLLVCIGLAQVYEPQLFGSFGPTVVILWLALAASIGVLATMRGRSFVQWSVLAFVLSPLVAGVALITLTRLKHPEAKKPK